MYCLGHKHSLKVVIGVCFSQEETRRRSQGAGIGGGSAGIFSDGSDPMAAVIGSDERAAQCAVHHCGIRLTPRAVAGADTAAQAVIGIVMGDEADRSLKIPVEINAWGVIVLPAQH